MKKDGLEKFKHMRLEYEDEDLFKMMVRKGVFPYEYMDSLDRLSETELPPREAFYSKLTDQECSEEDYEHARKVWDSLEMKSLKDYHDTYLKCDVLLLADIFENFREFSLKEYKLDPLHFYSGPGLSFESCLKMTGAHLELLTDVEQLNFFEESIRGGVSLITHRFAKANNPLVDGYDPDLEHSWIQYLDSNNLYGVYISFVFMNFMSYNK